MVTSKKYKPESDEETVSLFISSNGIETWQERFVDEQGKGVFRHFIYPSVNSETLKVECNVDVMVPVRFAEALQGLIKRQKEVI